MKRIICIATFLILPVSAKMPLPFRFVGAIVGLPLGAAAGLVGGVLGGASETSVSINPTNPTAPVGLAAKPLKIVGKGIGGALKGAAKGASRGASLGS